MKQITQKIVCQPYLSDIKAVKDIQDLIESYYKDLFVAVFVHGSIATDEICAYSDFDGLLIVRDKYKKSKLFKSFLNESMKIIFRFDPLQHHGWFIIFDFQLDQYPQTYFPIELFNYAKVIWPLDNVNIPIQLPYSLSYTESFFRLADSIQRKLLNKFRPNTMFELKSLLSEILLLPSLYYQAKNGKAIFKKYSFENVIIDFTDSTWYSIQTASRIRSQWHYIHHFPIWLLFWFSKNRISKIIYRRLFAPTIPHDIKLLLTDQFFFSTLELINEMKNKINEIQTN